MSLWEYRATVSVDPNLSFGAAVHDGDTIKLLIDQGMNGRTEQWIRLADVHAPELSERGGQDTRQFVNGWISDRVAPNGLHFRGRRWPLRVVTSPNTSIEPNERTTLARYVGWVYDLVDGDCLNAQVAAFLVGHTDWPTGK